MSFKHTRKSTSCALAFTSPRNGLLDVFSVFSSVLKMSLFLSADGVFILGCTLGCIYAVDFLLLETSCLDCVEMQSVLLMVDCGEHLAKVMISSVRRPCVLACVR